MTRKLVGAAVSMLALVGCGTQATTSHATALATRVAPPVAMTTGSSTVATEASETFTAPETTATPMTADLRALPTPPWSAPPITAREAPRSILSAWENAENRATCAPLASITLGAAEGARARTSELAGGWLVEFDRPGLPGVDRQGRECDTCGRSVVGIAGTAIAPDTLSDDGTLAPTYSDGSHSQIEVTDADGESVASMTFTVNGQGCVYEVWSLLGADHLAEVVSGLRFVEPPAVRGGALAAR